ncbi:MAG: hypothetical protein ACRDQ7_17105 [Haloechinothrix sp.]
MNASSTSKSREELAERIIRAVRAHPAVARLDGGRLGIVATYLPGRRVIGVRIPDANEPIQIGLVLRPGHRIPDAAIDIRSLVRQIAGEVAVDLTITDIAEGAEEVGAEQETGSTP